MPNPILAGARRAVVALGLFAAAAAAPAAIMPAMAYDETSTSAVNTDKSGLAIRGYDPVAYFTVGQPTLGSPEFTAEHEGATYRFADAANLAAFRQDPAKYVPAYGGFCAMGASLERKFDGDPKLWRIVDGKLYLNVAEDPHRRWLQDVPGNIGRADANWPRIRHVAPKDL